MAVVISRELAAKVQSVSNALPRMSQMQTVPEVLACADLRLKALFLLTHPDLVRITESQGKEVKEVLKDVVPQGGATANILYGVDQSGKGHKVCRTNVAYATDADRNAFLAQLSQFAQSKSVQELKDMYYAWLNDHCLEVTVWEDDQYWDALNDTSRSFSCIPVVSLVTLKQGPRAGQQEDRLSLKIVGVSGTKVKETSTRRGNISLGIADNTAEPKIEMVKFGANTMSVADARLQWAQFFPQGTEADWQTALAALPRA